MVPVVAPYGDDVLAGPERSQEPDSCCLEPRAFRHDVLDLGPIPLGDQIDRVAGHARRREVYHLIAVEDADGAIAVESEIDQPHREDAT